MERAQGIKKGQNPCTVIMCMQVSYLHQMDLNFIALIDCFICWCGMLLWAVGLLHALADNRRGRLTEPSWVAATGQTQRMIPKLIIEWVVHMWGQHLPVHGIQFQQIVTGVKSCPVFYNLCERCALIVLIARPNSQMGQGQVSIGEGGYMYIPFPVDVTRFTVTETPGGSMPLSTERQTIRSPASSTIVYTCCWNPTVKSKSFDPTVYVYE